MPSWFIDWSVIREHCVASQAMVRMALAEAITNLLWAPIDGWTNIKLQANWMWPASVENESLRLYEAVSLFHGKSYQWLYLEGRNRLRSKR
jgi:phosphoribosylformylglycinamidine (FGAM) synthase-like enzyme